MSNLNDKDGALRRKKEKLVSDYYHIAEYQTWLNRAYNLMLCKEGLIQTKTCLLLDKGLKAIGEKIHEEDLDPDRGDIYYFYFHALCDEVGSAEANRLHTGRSRNDMYFTECRMSLRAAILRIADSVLQTQYLLEQTAEQNLTTAIPYYTYGQPALPGTWAHYLMALHSFFSADLRRLRDAFVSVNQCPLGSAAGNGSSYPIDRKYLAAMLGFDREIPNSLAAVASVDYFLQTISALTILSGTISRAGSDLDHYSGGECGVLTGDADITEGSSIMPQKQNYLPGAKLRELSYDVCGYLDQSFASAASVGTFPAYETFHYFPAFWKNIDDVLDQLSILREAIRHSRIHKDRANEIALNHFTTAAAVAERLSVDLDLSFNEAHDIMADAVKNAAESRHRLTAETLHQALSARHIRANDAIISRALKMMDPEASLLDKKSGGTPNPNDTSNLIALGKIDRLDMSRWVETAHKQIKQACSLIDEEIARMDRDE